MQLQNSSYKHSDALIEADQKNAEVETIQNWLATKLAKVLSLNAKTIDVREPLTRYGLDSIDAVTLVGDLEDWLELELPATLLWDYPTIEKSAQYLVKEFDVSEALSNVTIDKQDNHQDDKTETASASKGWGGLWGKISGS